MGYILKCGSCGYGISSADTKSLINQQAEDYFDSCPKCRSKQFSISEQREKTIEFEDNASDEGDDDNQQSGLDDF